MKDQLPVGQGITIRLAEKDGKSDSTHIQIFRAGEYYHQYYGAFLLSEAVFAAMIANFKAKVYDIDLMIDYNHELGESAGWIKDLYMSKDGQELWAEVDWTKPGAEAVEHKLYRYISGDFHYNYVDNESQMEHGPVLFGAALTNRPFIKGMAPTTELNETGGNMTLQQLQDENKKLSEAIGGHKKEVEGKDAQIKQLSEEVASLKTKSEENVKLSEELKTLKSEKDALIKEQEFSVLLSEGRAVPAQKEAFMKGDMAAFVKASVKLNEKPEGHGKTETKEGEGEGDDKEAKILKLAEEKMKTGKFATMGDAISVAMKELA